MSTQEPSAFISALDKLNCDYPSLNDRGQVVHVQFLQWHCVAFRDYPDADLTVLLWIRLLDGTQEWAGGWWDGADWRLCESGGVCSGVVTHWAEPAGPAAC